MKFQNLKNKAKYALATVAVSAMSAPVMAEYGKAFICLPL